MAATVGPSMGNCLTEWKATSSSQGRTIPSPLPVVHNLYFLSAHERTPEFL